MEKDQAYGWLILLLSIVVIVVYIWAVFIATIDIQNLTLRLTGSAAIVFGFGIMAWIGYTLATTPPPEPIEIPEVAPEMEKPPVEKEEPTKQ